jgi:hypothetical protein
MDDVELSSCRALRKNEPKPETCNMLLLYLLEAIVVTAGWGWSGLPYLGRKRAKRAKDGRLRAKRAGRKGGRTL